MKLPQTPLGPQGSSQWGWLWAVGVILALAVILFVFQPPGEALDEVPEVPVEQVAS